MPTTFGCHQFINEPRFLSAEVVPADGRPEDARSETGTFLDIGTSRSDFTTLDALSVRDTLKKSPKEELLMDFIGQ